MERERRSSQLCASVDDQPETFLGLASRYAWYDERLVQDCAEFVDMRYYATSLSGWTGRYGLDPSYWVLSSDAARHVLPYSGRRVTGDPDEDVDSQMVDAVAADLAVQTMRLRDFRRRLKFQTRKNYMRGTNNLVILAVTEYLRDYGRYGRRSDRDELPEAFEGMKNVNLQDVGIVEYYDYTEYFNISCYTSVSAAGGTRDVSPRFWQGGGMDADGREFAKRQIDKFYLSSMMVKDGLGEQLGHNDLTDFLDVVFDYGAKRQFTDKNGFFATTLSSGEFTNSIVDELVRLSSDYAWLAQYAPTYYDFKNASVSAQAEEIVVSAVRTQLSAPYFEGISDSYQRWWPSAVALSAEMDACVLAYENALSAQDPLYFENSGSGDYYFENSQYAADNVADKTAKLQLFASKAGNMSNRQLIAALEGVA